MKQYKRILLSFLFLWLVLFSSRRIHAQTEIFLDDHDDMNTQITSFHCISTDLIRLHGAKWYFSDRVFKQKMIIKNTTVTAPSYFILGDWANGQLAMRWAKVSNVDGYYLYGYDDSTEEYNLLTEFPAETTSYALSVPKDKLCTKYRLRTFKKVLGTIKCSDQSITCGVATKESFSKDDSYFIGHRGVMDEAPEDTICSFDLAYEYGYPAIEADFYETKSGDLLISHARDLIDTCGVNMTVLDMTAAKIPQYPILHGNNVDKYEPQYLLTMEQFISHMADLDIAFYMHVKSPTMTKEAFKKVYDLLDQYGQLDHGHIFTSNEDCLEKLELFDWNYGFLKMPLVYTDYKDALDVSIDHGCEFLIYQYKESLPSAIIKEGNAHGIRVGFYDTVTKQSISREINNGANFLIINGKYFED